MIDVKEKLEIPLDHINTHMRMIIHPNMKGENLLFVESDHRKYNEAQFQVFEGKKYLYELVNADGWCIDTDKTGGTFTKIKEGDVGGFNPNTFVGTFQIPFIHLSRNENNFAHIEIRSTKISYEKGISDTDLNRDRSEYQLMIEHIAEHSIDLVLQYNVPIQQAYESGLEQIDDEKELYQRFLFVRSLFKNQEFEESVQKIISNPATRWMTEEEDRDIRSIRRFTPKNIRELTSRANRIPSPNVIPGLADVPLKISSSRKTESVDTTENRFIKHVLGSFLSFCEAIESKLGKAKFDREHAEVKEIGQRLENLLNQPFFKTVKRPTSLRINSPVLQRRSGYRELLRAWLRFHLTAQLSWRFDNDEDNLFTGGKKDIASLYEYWVFFVLFKIITEKFGQITSEDADKWLDGLIVPDIHGLGLTLQEGKKRSFGFKYKSEKRDLNLQFCYNRPFPGNREYPKSKKSGSYSKSFRPDYTLSIWPNELTDDVAEEEESIVHIHFDAKYKVDYAFFKEDESTVSNAQGEEGKAASLDSGLEERQTSKIVQAVKNEERQGVYKNIDLYKMHAYKDAIRRSGGAYILYPGTLNEKVPFRGFHEIIPGVGAFSVRPNNEGEAMENIKKFIDNVIENLEDVLSQRERMSKSVKRVYAETYKIQDPQIDILIRQLGSADNPDETHVLVGYCKNEKHLKWISDDPNNMRYNIRFGDGYDVNGKMAAARYLLLYTGKDFLHHQMYKIKQDSAKIITKQEMQNLNYSNPSHSLYFVYELVEKIDLDAAYQFDMQSLELTSKLNELKSNYRPFTLDLLALARLRKLVN